MSNGNTDSDCTESDSESSSGSEDESIRFSHKQQKNKNGFSDFCVKNIARAKYGRRKIELAEQELSGSMLLRKKSTAPSHQPLAGAKIIGCSRITARGAVLVETLVACGARVRWCACDARSTENDVAAALADAGCPVFSWRRMTKEDFWWCVEQCLQAPSWQPNLILDSGGHATEMMLEKLPFCTKYLGGVVEDSVAAVSKLYHLSQRKALPMPVISIHDSVVKAKLDAFCCSRDSIVGALKRTAGIMLTGSVVLVVGYGQVGKGCCSALKAIGAMCFVAEVDPVCGLQACMEGFKVVKFEEVARAVDIVVTATGACNVLDARKLEQLKHGCIVCNMGNSDGEINTDSLKGLKWKRVRDHVHHVIWPSGHHIVVLARGRQLNHSVPSLVVSVTQVTQVLAITELVTNKHRKKYKCEIYPLPQVMDEYVAQLHLATVGGHLTKLTDKQAESLNVDKQGPYKKRHYNY